MDKEHLNVQDIVIGDFVQKWLEIPGKWGAPMHVDGVFGDGSLHLNSDGNEADHFDANVKDVYDIPIDWGILPHFGFFEADSHLFQLEQGDWMVMVHVLKVCNTFHSNVMLSNKNGKSVLLGCVYSIRELQHRFYDETKEPLKLTFE